MRKSSPATKALLAFGLRMGEFRVHVRLLPTIDDVESAYFGAAKKAARLRSNRVHGFFAYPPRSSKTPGTIFLAADSDLLDIVPHEVSHAVVRYTRAVRPGKDEKAAALIGAVSSRILRRISGHIEIV